MWESGMFQWLVSQGFVKQHCTGEHCTRQHFSGLLASPTPPPQQTLYYYSCHLLTPPPPHNRPCATTHAIFSPTPHNRPCATTRALFSPFSSSRSTMCPWPWAEAMCSAVRPWGVQAFTSAPVTWDGVWKTGGWNPNLGWFFLSHCLWKHMYMRYAFSWQWLQHTQDQWLKFTTHTLTLNNACTGSNMPSPLPYWLQVIMLAVKGLAL